MRTLSHVVFFLAVAAVTGLGHFYLYRRGIVPTTRTRRGRRTGLAVLGVLWLGLTFARVLTFDVPGQLATVAAVGFWTWFGLALYLGLSLFAAQLFGAGRWLWLRLRRLVAGAPRQAPGVDEERRLFLARSVAGASALVSLGVGSFGLYRAIGDPEITEVVVKLPHLPKALEGFTLVQVSDIHIGDILGQRFLAHTVDRCNALKPDLVAITGDLVDDSVAVLGPTIATLQGLRSRHGSYFCTGNHEYYAGADAWCEALSRMGITVLRNRFVSIGEPGASFDLVGVDDWGARPRGFRTGYDLERGLQGRDPERASVLLAHQPANFDVVARKGLGLQLSGHTHGGQMFPFTDLVKLRWAYPRGRHGLGDSTLYVSRGTGFWGVPMRVDSPPEIVKVVLVA
jgi:predicted MPP superfamily phosphohydrolase